MQEEAQEGSFQRKEPNVGMWRLNISFTTDFTGDN